MKNISVHLLNELIEEAKEIEIIDIREEYELLNGFIPTTKNIPMYDLVYNHQQHLKKDIEYYIVCEHGVRSVNLINYLSQFGYHLVNVDYGTEMYSRFYPLMKN